MQHYQNHNTTATTPTLGIDRDSLKRFSLSKSLIAFVHFLIAGLLSSTKDQYPPIWARRVTRIETFFMQLKKSGGSNPQA